MTLSAWVLVIHPPTVSTSPRTSGALSKPTFTTVRSPASMPFLRRDRVDEEARRGLDADSKTLEILSTERNGFSGFDVNA